jgi:hypothetical protein
MKAQVKVAWVSFLQATSPLINDQRKSTLFPKIPLADESITNRDQLRAPTRRAYRLGVYTKILAA